MVAEYTPPRHWPLLAAVALVHGLVWLAWPSARMYRDSGSAATTLALTWVSIAPSVHNATLDRSPPVALSPRRPRPPSTPAAITVPAPVQAWKEPSSVPSPSQPAVQAQPKPLPLRLRLPSGPDPAPRMVDLARQDPRSNSRPASPMSRLASLADQSALWSEVPLAGDGRSRVTIRGRCAEVHVARNAQIDPFNQSVSPTPKQVRPCD